MSALGQKQTYALQQGLIDEMRTAISEAYNTHRELAEGVSAMQNVTQEAVRNLQQRADDLQSRIAVLEAAKAKRKAR